MQGLVRIAAAVPHLHLANPMENVREHLRLAGEAARKGAAVVCFPELSLTGATCGDLMLQQPLLKQTEQALCALRDQLPEGLTVIVGAPVRRGHALFNCAVAMRKGEFLAVIPKTFLNADDRRVYRSAASVEEHAEILLGGDYVPFGATLLESTDGMTLGVEIGADLFAPLPPSEQLALAGAEIILCPAAVSEIISGHEYRRALIAQQSARSLCGYVYVSAGKGESTTDLVFSGHSLGASCGTVLKENEDFIADDYVLTCDIDVERIRADRLRSAAFADAADMVEPVYRVETDALLLPEDAEADIIVSKQPFIPQDKASRQARCSQIFALQAAGLARRMAITGNKVVVGISGGLDSTLALLAACKAVDSMGLPRTNILGVTMPCFGTTDWTYQSALELMTTLGIQQREVPIHEAVRLHFRDIGHDEKDHSVTYENAQARERTQVLMDIANDFGGLVLGTGDLSEIALGWCTYNADHMSMYGVNSGVPKTLVRWVVKAASETEEFAASKAVLERILATPISPELLPPDEKGNIAQQTEDLVGPYALHDFFLYYAIRFGYHPRKVFDLCCLAFKDDFDRETILKWLKNFYRRFFTQQFKRNCSPDGVKIGSVALSPRGDWKMPSDAQSAAWLAECEGSSTLFLDRHSL